MSDIKDDSFYLEYVQRGVCHLFATQTFVSRVYAIAHFLNKVLFQQLEYSVLDRQIKRDRQHILTMNLKIATHPVRILKIDVKFVSRRAIQ